MPVRHPLLLAAMSAALPGSGHLYAGRRRAGFALLALVGCLLVAVALAVVLVPRDQLLGLAVRSSVLRAVMVAAVGGALVMLVVVLTAYGAGRPSRLPDPGRYVSHTMVTLLCVAVVAPFVLLVSYASAQHSLIGDVFAEETGATQAEDPWAGQERLNILLIGGDGKANREGIRNDSVTLASVDTDTGRTVMFSLPRNLEHAPFPPGSPAAAEMPDGFPDYFYGVYKYGTDYPRLFPGVRDPGAAAVSAVVGETLGLPVHYYALVDIDGFRQMIDALGGLRLRVEERIPIGGIAVDGSLVEPDGYVRPGLQTLDGYETLWYARSRAGSTDYERMARQRCVLGALAQQANPLAVLRNFRELAAATSHTIETNFPQSRLPDAISLADKVRKSRITSLQFVPPLIDSADPDFALIRHRVDRAIEASEAAPADGGGSPTTDRTASPSDTPTHRQESGRAPAASLDKVCSFE